MAKTEDNEKVNFSVRIDKKLRDQIMSAAAEKNISGGTLIRAMLDVYFSQGYVDQDYDQDELLEAINDLRYLMRNLLSNQHRVGANINQAVRALNELQITLKILNDNSEKIYNGIYDINERIDFGVLVHKLREILGEYKAENGSKIIDDFNQNVNAFDCGNSSAIVGAINEFNEGVNKLCQLLR